MSTITVQPHNQDRYTQRGKTTLWYTNVAYHFAHKGAPPPIIIKGTIVVKLPKLGEAIILDEVYASDLEFKTMYKNPETGVLSSAFTRHEYGGQQMAEYIAKALKEGADPQSIQSEVGKLRVVRVLEEASDEELLATFKQRYPDAPPELLAILRKDKQVAEPEGLVERLEPKVTPKAEPVEKSAASAASKLTKKGG